MKTSQLDPPPNKQESFSRKFSKFIPESSGCYVLSSADNVILYVGLAENLRRRQLQHLDNPQKTLETSYGRAFYFSWLETPDINRLERTWLHSHMLIEGRMPVLNSVFSPTSF